MYFEDQVCKPDNWLYKTEEWIAAFAENYPASTACISVVLFLLSLIIIVVASVWILSRLDPSGRE